MPEDTNESARRNLLVFSSTVLIYVWLGMPELVFLKKLLGLDAAAVEPVRFTAVAFLIQAYLVLRYRFSPASAGAIASFQRDFSSLRHKWVAAKLRQGLRDFNRTKKQPPFYRTDLNAYVAEALKREVRGIFQHPDENEADIAATVPMKMSLDYSGFTSGVDIWTGRVEVSRSYETDRKIGTSAGGMQLEYSFDRRARMAMTARAAPRLLYTHFAVEYAIPVAVAAFATVVLACRLVQGVL